MRSTSPPAAARRGPVSFAISRLAQAHREHARRLLERVGLHPAQELLLMALWDRDAADPSELAQALGVERPTMTKMLQRLERQGLIRRERSGADGRRVVITASSRAHELRPQVEQLWAELEQATTGALAPAERTAVLGLLQTLERGLRDGS